MDPIGARTDRDALIALFRSAGGANWRQNHNWDTDKELSEWYGVEVRGGRVVALRLGANNLQGTIPRELGKLAALTVLFLNDNGLTGTIPRELGKLAALTVLDLNDNGLTGTIPRELGKLAALTILSLFDNGLTGTIPRELGKLVKLKWLCLYGNRLTGGIPEELGNLAALTDLPLQGNKLEGTIPRELGKLVKLKGLYLNDNGLTGGIPQELGNLAALTDLRLQGNKLEGGIPEELGNLTALTDLRLQRNKLEGTIPRELGKLSALTRLYLHDNGLTGTIPRELGKLTSLKRLYLQHNGLTGGPRKTESLSEWTTRLQAELAEQERAEQSRAEEYSRLKPGRTNAVPAEHTSPSDEELMLRVQVASFANLDKLTRKNHEALDEVKRLLGNPAAGSVPDLTDTEKLRELNRLVAMANTLGKMASTYHEDEDIQRKEMALDPGPEAYYTAVRSGLCNAYVAASVVASGLVSTSKMGIMGKAGTALKLMSGAVPLVGGLAGFAGAALKAGDCYVKTRRVVKITDLAPDPVECSKLAKMLALRLIDGLTDAIIATSYDGEEIPTQSAAGVGWGAGGSESSPDSGTLAVGVSEEAVMEWFIEEVTHCEPTNCGATTGGWRRLGMRHVHQLLTAVGQSCLEGTHNTGQKVERLLEVISLAGTRPVDSSVPGRSFVRSPVRAPCNDGSLDREAEFAAMKAKLEALELADKQRQIADEQRQIADEQRQIADAKRQAELEALKSDKEMLLRKMMSFEKRVPRSSAESGDPVDAGGGQLLAVQRKHKTKEDFWQEAEDRARSTDEQTFNPEVHRLTQARLEEVEARVAAVEEGKRGKKGLRFQSRGRP